MANKFTDAVADLEAFSSVQKAVLTVLAQHANNDTGECWPSVGRISKKSRFKPTAVKKALAYLCAAEHISKVGKKRCRSGAVCVYKINENILSKVWREEYAIDWATIWEASPEKLEGMHKAQEQAAENSMFTDEDQREELSSDDTQASDGPVADQPSRLTAQYPGVQRPTTQASGGPLPRREAATNSYLNSEVNSERKLIRQNYNFSSTSTDKPETPKAGFSEFSDEQLLQAELDHQKRLFYGTAAKPKYDDEYCGTCGSSSSCRC